MTNWAKFTDAGPESTARAQSRNVAVTLKAYTHGVPHPDNFSVVERAVPTPAAGQALCRTLFVSLDPYLRLSLYPPDTSVPTGGAHALPIGDVIRGRGVAEVVESNIDDLPPGALVAGVTGWQTYSVLGTGDIRRVDGVSPPSAALGVLGMPGFTAWSGLKFVGRPQAGQTVVVSAASGAVGSLVVQLARRLGCRSVGIAGADDKCRWVRDVLRADECVSHRSPSLADDLARACPNGIDVYFDNVGGDVLGAVLPSLNQHARVVVCGRISHLNEDPLAIKVDRLPALLGTILTRRLVVEGLNWADFADRWDEFIAEVAPLVTSGEVRYEEDIVEGLDQIPAAYARLFDGSNFGKLVARV